MHVLILDVIDLLSAAAASGREEEVGAPAWHGSRVDLKDVTVGRLCCEDTMIVRSCAQRQFDRVFYVGLLRSDELNDKLARDMLRLNRDSRRIELDLRSVEQRLELVGGYGEIDAGSCDACFDDADDLSLLVQHRTTRVAGIQGGIQLNHLQKALRLAQSRDVTGTDCDDGIVVLAQC